MFSAILVTSSNLCPGFPTLPFALMIKIWVLCHLPCMLFLSDISQSYSPSWFDDSSSSTTWWRIQILRKPGCPFVRFLTNGSSHQNSVHGIKYRSLIEIHNIFETFPMGLIFIKVHKGNILPHCMWCL
jgi:hypothetical protein